MANIKEKNRKEESAALEIELLFLALTKTKTFSFRSNLYTYAQLIDDNAGKTVASASTKELVKAKKGKKVDR